MDALKETLDAWLARVKSPVLGYIVLAFVLVNWKPLWFLAFADQSVIDKFEFFDARTDSWSLYVWPVSIGLVAATAAPWVELLGAWIAQLPTLLRKKIQDNHDTEVLIAALDNATRLEVTKVEREEKKQAAIELAALERAKRNQSALEIGEDAVNELQKARVSGQSELEKLVSELDARERLLITVLSKSGSVSEAQLPEMAAKAFLNWKPSTYTSGQRALVEAKACINRLIEKRLVQTDGRLQVSLTEEGFQVSDLIVGI